MEATTETGIANFGSPPQQIVQEFIDKYKVPIEGFETDLGEIVCRAISFEELEEIYKEATVQTDDGRTDISDEKFKLAEISRGVIWPKNITKIITHNSDVLPGGLISSITTKIEELSGMVSVVPVELDKYITLTQDEKLQNGLHKNRPTLEQLNDYKNWQEKNRKVYVLPMDSTDTDYVYRSFSLLEMNEMDKDTQEHGGLNQSTINLPRLQKLVTSKCTLFPLDYKTRIDEHYKMPAWIPSLLMEGIFLASGSTTATVKKYSTGN